MKIKCIGFSVTGYGEFPYPISLKAKLLDLGVDAEVSYASVGGLSIDALGYLLDPIIGAEDHDLIVLEIATSWFSLFRESQGDADILICRIVEYFEFKCKNIVFLNLYRKNISDQDFVVNAIDNYKNNYPVLDVKLKYREKLMKGESDGTTDGVHPTKETIEEIAVDLANFICRRKNNINHIKSIDTHYFAEHKILLPVIEGGIQYHFNNRHGVSMNGLKISGVSDWKFEFERPTPISGIFFAYGPDTNSVTIKIESEVLEVPMYDNLSFYRRLGYRYFGEKTVTNIEMHFNYSEPGIILDREPWEKFENRSCYFLGFSS